MVVSTITQIESASGAVSWSTISQTETETTTSTFTEVSSFTETETTTSTVTEVSSTTETATTTSTITEVSSTTATVTETTQTATTTAGSGPAPVVTNGSFESGDIQGWTIISQNPAGGSVVGVGAGGQGGSYFLDIFTSYFLRSAAASVVVGQPLNCIAGIRYRVSVDVAYQSSYSNGNPWTVLVGGATMVTSTGASIAWTTVNYMDYLCAGDPAVDVLQFRAQSNSSREGHLMVDNVIVTALSVAA